MLKNNFPNIKNIQLVILSGGFGKRLGLLTKNNPKPLIVINKKPFLEYLVNYLVKQGFKKFLFQQLQRHMVPLKIIVKQVEVGHRHKRS